MEKRALLSTQEQVGTPSNLLATMPSTLTPALAPDICLLSSRPGSVNLNT